MSRLRRLWLSDTRVSDVGVSSLEALRGLEELHLDGTGVTEAGASRLARSLPGCRIER